MKRAWGHHQNNATPTTARPPAALLPAPCVQARREQETGRQRSPQAQDEQEEAAPEDIGPLDTEQTKEQRCISEQTIDDPHHRPLDGPQQDGAAKQVQQEGQNPFERHLRNIHQGRRFLPGFKHEASGPQLSVTSA